MTIPVQHVTSNIDYGVFSVKDLAQDLSGSLQGAGGIGGLISVTRSTSSTTETFYPCCDGNGNISDYVNSNGTVVAHREFDAYGNTISSSGNVNDFNFWFSTKYWDSETGLGYWGHRYYQPITGRWLSRDPIGDLAFRQSIVALNEGGSALSEEQFYIEETEKEKTVTQERRPVYLFVSNEPTSAYDAVGLFGTSVGGVSGGPGVRKCGIVMSVGHFSGHVSDWYNANLAALNLRGGCSKFGPLSCFTSTFPLGFTKISGWPMFSGFLHSGSGAAPAGASPNDRFMTRAWLTSIAALLDAGALGLCADRACCCSTVTITIDCQLPPPDGPGARWRDWANNTHDKFKCGSTITVTCPTTP